MAEKNVLKIAVEMARQSIYDGAKFIGKWKGYDVYEPTFDDDEPRFIGFPQFILAKSDIVRWCTDDEIRPIMNAFSSDDE